MLHFFPSQSFKRFTVKLINSFVWCNGTEGYGQHCLLATLHEVQSFEPSQHYPNYPMEQEKSRQKPPPVFYMNSQGRSIVLFQSMAVLQTMHMFCILCEITCSRRQIRSQFFIQKKMQSAVNLFTLSQNIFKNECILFWGTPKIVRIKQVIAHTHVRMCQY